MLVALSHFPSALERERVQHECLCLCAQENYLFLYEAAASLSDKWKEKEQSSPGSIRLHLGSKKNGAPTRIGTLNNKVENNKVETDV